MHLPSLLGAFLAFGPVTAGLIPHPIDAAAAATHRPVSSPGVAPLGPGPGRASPSHFQVPHRVGFGQPLSASEGGRPSIAPVQAGQHANEPGPSGEHPAAREPQVDWVGSHDDTLRWLANSSPRAKRLWENKVCLDLKEAGCHRANLRMVQDRESGYYHGRVQYVDPPITAKGDIGHIFSMPFNAPHPVPPQNRVQARPPPPEAGHQHPMARVRAGPPAAEPGEPPSGPYGPFEPKVDWDHGHDDTSRWLANSSPRAKSLWENKVCGDLKKAGCRSARLQMVQDPESGYYHGRVQYLDPSINSKGHVGYAFTMPFTEPHPLPTPGNRAGSQDAGGPGQPSSPK